MDEHGDPLEPTPLRAVVGIDAAFWHTETPSTHWHVLGVVLLDDTDASEPFDAEMFRRVLADRIDDVEVLRRRVVDQGVGVSHPHWELTDVDLDHHVRSATLPAGSGIAELAALAGEIGSVPLPRDRPMWEFTVVDGLADGRPAIVAKIHHSLVDGVAAVGVMSAALGPEPVVPPLRTRSSIGVVPQPPRDLGSVTRSVVDQPAMLARSFTRLMGTAWRLALRTRNRERLPTLPIGVPRTSMSRSITASRAASFATLEVDAVKEVRRAFGVTFNDVALAVTAGVVREWLGEIDDLPDRPLVAAIPTSVRRGDDPRSGNELSMLFGALPTHLNDPSDRVRFVAREMPDAKAFHEELGPRTLGSLALVAPWNIASLLFRAYSGLGLADRLPLAVNLIVSSVPGPQIPLYCGGARVDAVFPLGPILDGVGLNVTLVSYTDKVCIGFLTCPDVGPPVQHLADVVPAVVDELVAAAHAQDLEPTHRDERETRMDTGSEVQERNRRALAAVQERRDDLYEAILGLERVMAAAAGDDAAGWATTATTAALDLRSVLRHHVTETEATGSFYDDIVDNFPNLIPAADRLKAEHAPLQDDVDRLVEQLSTVRDDADVEAARERALDLLRGLLHHRHRGSELVYDAYNVDVAPGD